MKAKMIERRCYNCNHLFFKQTGEDLEVEVICPNCNTINYTGREDMCVGLRGNIFGAHAIRHYCKHCPNNRLLFKSMGYGIIETKCKVCKKVSVYDTKKIREGKETQKLNSEIAI